MTVRNQKKIEYKRKVSSKEISVYFECTGAVMLLIGFSVFSGGIVGFEQGILEISIFSGEFSFPIEAPTAAINVCRVRRHVFVVIKQIFFFLIICSV